ncbi:cell division FtsA domain-containing protein [Petroclostridium xylanilyticum]|uniref:cell division FtsA domain-containing protein n=1 Tax=Petroclostridium xylanilyticum TaxID=1792311 RepID=UPI000B99766A|nr:cell division FtsA domain-containing protein [Petroclostridium xylanilyticum]
MKSKDSNVMNSNDLIFALDIGTRTVVGIAGVQEKDKFKVLAAEIIEHKSRAMLDGQVHDIEKVADVVREVKGILEKKTGIKLNKAAIAAAGRVLKTKQVNIQKDINPVKEIDRELIKSLEMEGIQLAQLQLDEELFNEEKVPYYCVGYDVINYYLNNYVISSLVGHKGKTIGADILATFLPHTVVDSLYTVMNRVGLEVESLTLEPIAAINVAIPKNLRLLNLALVDIGAGTSDIAITKNGSVVAYAMVPVAGDEITELICQHYLIDFNTGEKIKTALSSSSGSISFVDIMGNKQTKKIDEIKALIQPAIEHLADTITQKILEYNQKAPNAVFLVGGGSQIGGLPQLIASRLNLPPERVAVRGRDVIQNVKISGKKLSGPEAITPIGIAVTAQIQKGHDFLYVTVNGKKIRLFNSRKLIVADALILVGFNPGDLIGKTGKPLNFELNGEKKTLRGEYGNSAEIYVNGKIANLETAIITGDNITIKPAEAGRPAQLSVKEIMDYYADADSVITVNGQVVPEDYMVQDGDKIEFVKKVHEEMIEPQQKTDVNQGVDKNKDQDFSVSINQFSFVPNQLKVMVNGREVIINGNKQEYMFVDIFNFIDFDLSKPQGSIVLKLNGKQAAFTDIIKPGDEIEIGWE